MDGELIWRGSDRARNSQLPGEKGCNRDYREKVGAILSGLEARCDIECVWRLTNDPTVRVDSDQKISPVFSIVDSGSLRCGKDGLTRGDLVTRDLQSSLSFSICEYTF
jgi:hypothetical protein